MPAAGYDQSAELHATAALVATLDVDLEAALEQLTRQAASFFELFAKRGPVATVW
jgi:hypothetical protein